MADDMTEPCNCLALRRAARRVTQAYDAALAGAGVNATQFPVLAALHLAGPTAVGVLARRLGMDRATLGHNLRPMLAREWVRMDVGTDRRQRDVRLTTRGHEVLHQALPLWRGVQHRFETAFGAQDARSLRDTLARVEAVEFATA